MSKDLAGNEFIQSYTTSIDHDNVIPADKRTGSAGYSMAMLCKQDKKQLDRIEAKLDALLGNIEN